MKRNVLNLCNTLYCSLGTKVSSVWLLNLVLIKFSAHKKIYRCQLVPPVAKWFH
jgi:hypothetical protein